MKNAMRRVFAMLLAAVLLATFLPDSMAGAVAAYAEQIVERRAAQAREAVPVREITPAQAENAAAVAALLADAGAEAQEGDFRYRPLGDGTVAVTGYGGSAAQVTLPRTLGGGDVVAIASGAFGPEVRAVEIHGNAMYIADDALARGAAVSAWQGSYAAAWAQARGRALSSLTEGVLYANVADMTDALDRMRVLSDSMISVGATEARRLSAGDLFILNRGEGDESFYRVTGKRAIGARMYLTVRQVDITEIYSYRLYEGEKSITKTFTDVQEAGVDVSDGDIAAASEVLEKPPTSKAHTHPNQNVTIPLPKSREINISYKQVTTVTSSYRVVVEGGKVIDGTMAKQQEDVRTVEVKYKEKGKICSIDGGVGGKDMTAEQLAAVEQVLRWAKGKEPGKKLGSYTFIVVPAIGLGFELNASVGWEVGGSGKVSWTSRSLDLYDYVPSKGKWGFRESKELNNPDPELSGAAYGKISGSVGCNLIVGYVTSELHTKAEASIGFSLSIPSDPDRCIGFSVNFTGTISVEAGLWFHLGSWEIQAASVGSIKITLWDIKLVDLHYSKNQGIHPASRCAYTPMDYCLRFVTGTSWQPDSICYLKKGTYSYHPVTAEVLSFEAESVFGNVDKVSVVEPNHISFDYGKNPTALDDKITLPQQNRDEKNAARWRIMEPATVGDYEWDDNLTVKQNLETAYGKTITSEKDLPKAITLEAEWSDKYRITYDANGGKFDANTGVGTLLTKYYAPGEICQLPYEQPTKDLALFTGWTEDIEGKKEWKGGTAITENMRVYAQYENFDPTDHSTINSRFGATPTLIGDAKVRDQDPVNWELKFNGWQTNPSELTSILQNGVDAFESSDDWTQFCETFGGGITCTPALRNFKGRAVGVDGKAAAFALTGLVDETLAYGTFVVPSTINGLPVVMEKGVMQKLRASTVVFAPTPDASVPGISLTQSDDSLFMNNLYVKHVYMDKTGIINLGDKAFSGCANLEGVSLPGTLQQIGAEAFKGCGKLTKAVFGLQVDTIKKDAFHGCTALVDVSVSTPYLTSMSEAFRDDDGVPAHIDLKLEKMVHVLPGHAFNRCKSIKSLTVNKDGLLRTIGGSAFENCPNLARVKLNEGLESIGCRAFAYTAIGEIVIPSTVTDYYYFASSPGYSIFYNTPLKKITIGGAITCINQGMLDNEGTGSSCSTLEEIVLRDGVTEISDYCFNYYMALEKVWLPKTLTTIGAQAFFEDTSLMLAGVDLENQAADLVLPEGVTTIGNSAFQDCTVLTSAIIPKTVTAIGESAFWGCGSLSSVKLSEGLKSIGCRAFADTAIEEIVIPSTVTDYYYSTSSHGYSIFYNTPLKKITIGGAITSIKQCMLDNEGTGSSCSTLEKIVLRDGVTEISDYCFNYYTALEKVWLPKTLTTIGYSAFYDCGQLKRVGVDLENQAADLVLPEGVTTIGSSAFQDCTALKSAIIPKTVTAIGESAFLDCGSLSSVKLNEGLQSIGSAAFSGTALTEIVIPSTVTDYYYSTSSPGYSIFYRAPLKKITIGGAITSIKQCMLDNDTDYSSLSTLEEIVLRDGVTEISDYGFNYYTALKKVRLPKTLTTIGDSAFYDCGQLKRVGVDPDKQTADLVLPEGVTTIGSSAFQDCTALKSAIIPKTVTAIGESAFLDCGSLSSVKLNEGLQSIGSAAFSGTALTEIVIPSTVTDYYYSTSSPGYSIFYRAPLKKITIGGAITSIKQCMLDNDTDYSSLSTLQEIVLRDGVTEISDNGFNYYTALKKVWLPKTLTTIGDSAFSDATHLNAVYAGPNLNAIGSNAFSNAHPTFYAIPGTERNAWLADWCQANGFTYDSDLAYRVSVTFSLGSLAGKIEGERVQGSSATEVDALGLLEEPETPACEGWRFLGWFAPDSDEPWDFAHDRVGTDDLVLTARWQREGANGLYRIENGEATLVSYALAEGDDTDVALPPAWKGCPVTAIEDGAFAGEGLTSLTLPAQVSGVTAATFEGADSLAWIFTTPDCLDYRARNGILYSADMTELIYCPASRNLETLALPEDVTDIGAGALRGQETLEEIEFNSALERIGDGAFEGCDRLSGLTLPDSLLRIGAAAFRGCDGLRRVGGGANLQTIGDNAFALTGFCIFYGEEASALARYAQANERLYNLYDVTYQLDGESVATRRVKSGEPVPEVLAAAPDGRVVRGGWYADAAMETEWDFDADRMPLSDLTLYAATLPMFVTQDYTPEGEGAQVGARVTGYNGTETEITIPDEIDGKAVYAVDAAAFPNGCALTLPGGLLEIDAAAFAEANITLYAPAGSATEQLLLDAGCALNRPMRTLAFEVNGGAQVSAIRAQAGSEIALPGAVRDGGELTGWYDDADLTSRVGGAGESYTVPEDGATLYAGWSGDAPDYDFLWKQEGEEIVVTGGRGRKAVEVPATVNGLPVTRIADSAFDSDAALEEIDLPEGLLAIGSYAFRGSDLNGIALPATVTSIGRYAFSGCRWLLRCEWPAATTEMQEGMFSGDTALQALTLPEGLRKIDARALEQCEMLKTLALPDSVTDVGSEAFRDMKGLRTLTIGSGLTGLGSDALDGCAALSAIEVSQNNENYVSVDGVLYYADQAGLVKYPAGKAGESYAVSENAMLIEAHAFAGAALEEIALPDGIAQIGEGAFANSGLTGIDLSGLSALAQLPEGAFEDCRALEAVNLPDGLTGIGGGAFDGCAALAELDVPDAVTVIGGDAFSAYSELICGADTAALDYALAYGLAYRLRGAAIVPAQEIACDRDSLTLMAGLPFHLTATVSPADATDALEWASSDTEVLRVDGGYIRPLKPGEAEITARAGEAERTIPVRVVGCALEIEQASCWLYTDGALRLTLRNIADNYEMTGATWACEGGAVTQNGTLSADATGIVTVSASAPEGGTIARQFAFIARDQAMILPAAVKRIDDEAFRGMSGMTCAVIPDGATTIGAYAFADCGALGLVRIPESVTAIDDTAFDNSPNVILICGADSAAGAFAERNGMRALLVP